MADRALAGSAVLPCVKATDIVDKLLDRAVELGDMREKAFKHVPELLPYADDLGKQIWSELAEEFSDDPTLDGEQAHNQLLAAWSIFTGFGAVLEWNRDWPGLRARGVWETLSGPRGCYALDEHVAELYTGKHVDTDAGIEPPACKAFIRRTLDYAEIASGQVLSPCSVLSEEQALRFVRSSRLEVAKAGYLFGCSWALEKVMG